MKDDEEKNGVLYIYFESTLLRVDFFTVNANKYKSTKFERGFRRSACHLDLCEREFLVNV